MLLVFLVLYAALGVGCVAHGVARRTRTAIVCGTVTLALAAGSLVVLILYAAGADHWTVAVLQALLSPMPESLVQPGTFDAATQGTGIPVVVFAVIELIVAIALWAIPVFGIIVASRAPRREPTT
ncbi:hypothetical protein [Microbacterium sp.]|uniref:hypothetical protein n=1 Tax=Microbacterium sp. TaxID=51671 RepID=UPI002E36284C|nr:hypothetical protein [Microbacterium sp.]HEX5727827.1 hypothetical protein [Microbacterium sp.]